MAHKYIWLYGGQYEKTMERVQSYAKQIYCIYINKKQTEEKK